MKLIKGLDICANCNKPVKNSDNHFLGEMCCSPECVDEIEKNDLNYRGIKEE